MGCAEIGNQNRVGKQVDATGARVRGAVAGLAVFGIVAGIVALGPGCARETEPPELRGAILIVLDTLRADRLSAYGNPRETSPMLDALARRGTLFERAVSPATWTLPGFAALLAGRYPSAETLHGMLRESLVESLRDAGLRTAAFTEGRFVSRYYGIDRGFEEFSEVVGELHADAAGSVGNENEGGIEATFGAAIEWLRAKGSERFFLMVHTYEVHTPYRRREYAAALASGGLSETFEVDDAARALVGELDLDAEALEYVRALYDGGVAKADRHVGVLLEALRTLGLADETLVVVTSDHGEDLGDREPLRPGNHGHSLYQEMVRVPLILRDPREPRVGSRVAAQVRTVDVMPTVLELLDVPFEPLDTGRSLVPLMRGEEKADRPAFARIVRRKGGGIRMQMLATGRYKLIQNAFPVQPPAEVYDFIEDPTESRNLAVERPDVLERLEGELQSAREPVASLDPPVFVQSTPMPEDIAERLRALGYAE